MFKFYSFFKTQNYVCNLVNRAANPGFCGIITSSSQAYVFELDQSYKDELDENFAAGEKVRLTFTDLKLAFGSDIKVTHVDTGTDGTLTYDGNQKAYVRQKSTSISYITTYIVEN